MVRLTDRLDMIIVVDWDIKLQNKRHAHQDKRYCVFSNKINKMSKVDFLLFEKFPSSDLLSCKLLINIYLRVYIKTVHIVDDIQNRTRLTLG